MAAPLPKGIRSSYLAERQQIIEALPLRQQHLGPGAVVVAQHGDEFLVTWLLGITAQQTFPASSAGKSIYWMIHQVKPNAVTTDMMVVMEEENGSALVLMKHDDMAQWITILNERDRNQLWEANPHLKKYMDDQSKSHTTTLSPSHPWSVPGETAHPVQHLPGTASLYNIFYYVSGPRVTTRPFSNYIHPTDEDRIVSMQALDNVDVILTAQGSVDGVRSDQSVKKRSRKPLQNKQVAV